MNRLRRILNFEESRSIGMSMWAFLIPTWFFVLREAVQLGEYLAGHKDAVVSVGISFDQWFMATGAAMAVTGGKTWLEHAKPKKEAPDAGESEK